MRVIVVAKKSSYTQIGEDKATQNLLLKPALKKARAVHQRHHAVLDEVLSVLKRAGIRPWVLDGAGTAFGTASVDLVITVGGDGTLLAASHYIEKGIPVLGINSDPKTSVGHFCALKGPLTPELIKFNFPRIQVTRMEVLVRGNSVAKRVLNEALFSHACPAATSNFKLGSLRRMRDYKCSGVWVGTGAGSTGALRSAGGHLQKMTSKTLQAVVRELYDPDRALINPTRIKGPEIKAVSKMTEAVLYLDGPFLQVPVGLGDTVTFRISKEPLTLLRPILF